MKRDLQIRDANPSNSHLNILPGCVYEVCGLQVCGKCVQNRVPGLLRPLNMERVLHIRETLPSKSDLHTPQRRVSQMCDREGAWEGLLRVKTPKRVSTP